MTDCQTYRGPLAALALSVGLACGAWAAEAATVEVTLDFGTTGNLPVASPYVEDGFEASGIALILYPFGTPPASILLDGVTTSLTLKRAGGGAFSLIRFDYSCNGGICDFSVGSTPITSGSASIDVFATGSPAGLADITSLEFTLNNSELLIDNIVLSYNDVAPIPLPAGLPLLLGGLAGLVLMAQRPGRTA